ncbi:hypothetical protein DFH09DRAFT_1068963 [Mycena vulgaris]|nr:hypothetical protein DFH09DRAFT_1068963 [Mycena vulgaris]
MNDNPHPPTIQEAMANLSLNSTSSITDNDNSINHGNTSTDSDSTSSCPDLVPISSSNNSVDKRTDTMQDVSTVARNGNAAAIGVNGIAHRGVQTAGPSQHRNWGAPAYLAQRALQDAFADHLCPQGFAYYIERAVYTLEQHWITRRF